MTSVLLTLRVSLARTGMMMRMSTQSDYAVKRKAVSHSQMLRVYSTGAGWKKGKNWSWTILGAAGAGVCYYLFNGGMVNNVQADNCKTERTKADYQAVKEYDCVYNAIAELLNDPEYDDGSYGPIFVRLAWHASGTYDRCSNTGGSNKATMRFEPESKHSKNAGLHIARERLENVKWRFPWISYGDLWTLAAVVAVQEMGGPVIPWRPGRVDGTASDCPPDGRLPNASNPTPNHEREIFYRMGFNDQEIVALVGAHTLGRCHVERQGYEGTWSTSPTDFSNSFFVEILNRTWVEKKWDGKKQFEDLETGQLMMLPADLSFVKDHRFKEWVVIYSKSQEKFFMDFAKAFQKLLELGVPFPEGTKEFKFKKVE